MGIVSINTVDGGRHSFNQIMSATYFIVGPFDVWHTTNRRVSKQRFSPLIMEEKTKNSYYFWEAVEQLAGQKIPIYIKNQLK